MLAWTFEGGTLAPPFSCAPEIADTGGRCTAALQGTFTLTFDRSEAVLRDGGEVVARGIDVHQTALYDMLLAGLLFAFLWWFIGSPAGRGWPLVFALSYGCVRLLEDSLRIDKRFGPFTGSQWTALTVAIVAAGFLIVWAASEATRRHNARPGTRSRRCRARLDVVMPQPR